MIRRIALRELTVGMYIHRFDGAWMDHPFWRAGFVLKTERDVAKVRASRVRDVWIDTTRGLAPPVPVTDAATETATGSVPDAATGQAPEPATDAAPEPAAPHGDQTDPTGADPSSPASPGRRQATIGMEQALGEAAALCRVAKQSITSVFEEARMGRLGDSSAARGLVEEISDAVIRNPGALVSLSRLKTADTYTYLHSVAVCALMVALSRQLGLDEAQVRAAGMAGLMHDIGKAGVPLEVLNKPGRLTEAEFALVQRHPEHGHALLLAGGEVVGEALDGCLHHHEKFDGTGYPHRLAGEQIGRVARMTAICDVYDAVTSDRPYKKAWDPSEAIRRMAEWSGSHFDKALFQVFVKSIGIYPVGSLVRLASGRLGVVMEQSDSLVAPRVKVFFSTKSQLRIVPEVLDLARMANEKIVAREDPDQWRFSDLNELWSGFATPHW
jgi:HD-GYP domain-containing protein (c-di-GMP phosphodiesterase class II)